VILPLQLLNQRPVCWGKAVLIQFVYFYPGIITMNCGTDYPSSPAANICQQPDGTFIIFKSAASEEFSNFNIYAELFLHLTDEALLRALPFLDFASGKFPVTSQRIVVCTLGNQDLLILKQDSCDNVFNYVHRIVPPKLIVVM